jgi:hypothetical protein
MSPDDNFVSQVTNLEYLNGVNAVATQNMGPRQWMLPTGTNSDYSFSDPRFWIGPYSRSNLGLAYQQALSGPSQGICLALKLQSDYLAGQERSCRLNYLDPIRASIHAAARRAGHALPDGVLGRVVRHVQDILTAVEQAQSQGTAT